MIPSVGASMFFVIALFTFMSVFLWWIAVFLIHWDEISKLRALSREAANIENIIKS